MIDNISENGKNKTAEEIIADNSPELLLKLKKSETHKTSIRPTFSEPRKLILLVVLFDIIYAAIASLISGESHFILYGSFVFIPWPMALLDGLVFIGYGIYVKKRKRGELDISTSSYSRDNEIHTIEGESAVLLAWIYIAFGIFLLAATILSIAYPISQM